MSKVLGTIYYDMDGVLAKWNDAPIEEVAMKGYFLHREPDPVAIASAKMLIAAGYNVGTFSSVFNDSHSKQDKLEWLSIYLPELDRQKAFFSTYGQPKHFPGLSGQDILLDDHTPNLLSWGGVPVKYLNGINGKHGRFKGFFVSNHSTPEVVAQTLAALASFNANDLFA